MKKNSNGFTILETLITSTLVISTLVFLYVQFNNLERNYDDSFRFNTVNGIHKAKELSKYYQANSDKKCAYGVSICLNASNDVYDILNIQNSYLMSDLKASEIDFSKIQDTCDEGCKRFIKRIKTDTNDTRLVVKYNDGTYASVLIK